MNIYEAARFARARCELLTQDGLLRRKVDYKPEGNARLLMVDAVGEGDPAGLKPSSFPENLLARHLTGERVVVASTIPGDGNELVVGTLLCSGDRRLVLIVCTPDQHAAWSAAAMRFSGDYPLLHIADEHTVVGGDPARTFDLRAKVVH